jgi:hypothetical protein
MNSSIQVYNSYLKGTNTIFGSFPIYIASSELNCNLLNQKNNMTLTDVDEILNEFNQYYILTDESNDIDAISIFVKITSADKYQYILSI